VYTGFRIYQVDDVLVEDIHRDNKILVWDKRYTFYPNMYVELRSSTTEKYTALGRVDPTGTRIEKIFSREISGITPRNREQVFALDALMDDDIPIVALTGTAGTGKTILTLAAAIHKLDERRYKKIILTKPMSEVTRYKLGALPGDVSEKFGPYLTNYTTNLERFVGNKRAVWDLLEQHRFEIIPLQLFRGASFNESLVIADECQVLNQSEVLTIGTRIGENSKLVIMGDLNQRDEKIAKDKTGIYKLVEDKRMKESPLVATIQLIRCERSEAARLFAEVFEE